MAFACRVNRRVSLRVKRLRDTRYIHPAIAPNSASESSLKHRMRCCRSAWIWPALRSCSMRGAPCRASWPRAYCTPSLPTRRRPPRCWSSRSQWRRLWRRTMQATAVKTAATEASVAKAAHRKAVLHRRLLQGMRSQTACMPVAVLLPRQHARAAAAAHRSTATAASAAKAKLRRRRRQDLHSQRRLQLHQPSRSCWGTPRWPQHSAGCCGTARSRWSAWGPEAALRALPTAQQRLAPPAGSLPSIMTPGS